MILDKARELADAIGESKELAELRQAETKMWNDQAAQAIVEEFQAVQQKVYEAQMKGQELSEEQKKEVSEMEAKMEGSPIIMEYIQKQNEFEQMLKAINTMISRAIAGDGGCGCEECGPGCDSCGPQ